MEHSATGYTSRSRAHTGTRFPEAVLQDLKEPLTQCKWSQLYELKNALTDHGKKLRAINVNVMQLLSLV